MAFEGNLLRVGAKSLLSNIISYVSKKHGLRDILFKPSTRYTAAVPAAFYPQAMFVETGSPITPAQVVRIEVLESFPAHPVFPLPFRTVNFFLSLLHMTWAAFLPDLSAVGRPPPGSTHWPIM